MEYKQINKEQTNILKGIGIILIVLHNYFHNLNPVIGEQEFYFSQASAINFLQELINHPEKIIRILFSYFGHYGVQIFIFLSAYGLTRKYQKIEIKYLSFFIQRTKKIYLAFFVCMAIYICLQYVNKYYYNGPNLPWKSLIWKATILSNFIPGEALKPVGPWWFFPLIIQIYAIFPILLKLHKQHGAKICIWISIAFIFIEATLNQSLQSHGLNINYTTLGHIPIIFMGIYFGYAPKFKADIKIFIYSFIIFISANFNSLLWLIADIAFIIFLLCAKAYIFKYLQFTHKIKNAFSFFGENSLYLFLVNGFLRSPFYNFAQLHDVWWIDNIAGIASLIFSTIFALLLKKLTALSAFFRLSDSSKVIFYDLRKKDK